MRIIEILATGPACTCHLVDDLDAKQPTVSHHLKVLREAGLVEAEPVGRFTYYKVVPGALSDAAGRLSALADLAERSLPLLRECD